MGKGRNNKELAYYLTLFKIEGHETWRTHLGGDDHAFSREQTNWTGNKPVVTEKKQFRIDRITGEIACMSDGMPLFSQPHIVLHGAKPLTPEQQKDLDETGEFDPGPLGDGSNFEYLCRGDTQCDLPECKHNHCGI